ncbi:probable cytochrome P450 6a23 [Halyomorpha halys]|uniref:probable cytochrome P450 6a23 n=1 Tax=Halyomorpha halys TaxID=286706 RepID=UPI0006D4CDE1|nr:probable cytochrome P450 6a23 [Halyomorpha halys]XP_014285595.1 probable cytochrome P450 6a23 [Halyomorpha halys]
MLGLVTSLICLICGAAYIYLRRRYRYWKNLGIPGPEPRMILGNMKDLYCLKSTEPDMMQEWYTEYRKEPYIGYYNFWKPTLFVLDPELTKAITEVDFNHFTDHPSIITAAETDSALDSLFTMKGLRWKLKRQIFSKLFSPKKLRDLSNILEQHNDTLLKAIDEELKSADEIELMGIFEQHIVKIITSFLYSIDSYHNRERHTKLLQLSDIFARPAGTTTLRFLFFTVFPNLYAKLGLSALPSAFWDYFTHFTHDLLYSRKEVNVEHDDLVALIEKMQKGLVSEKIDHHEAVGHMFTFFVAAQDTTMTTLSHALYQLSLHPEIQEKLRTEIDSVLDGKDSITYDDINQMNYLDDVINETLRMFPLLGVLKRTCTEPYKINDKFTIPKGMDISLPAYSFHTDPEYYPEPEKFLPERFSDAGKAQALFMPFGKGPRTCIGIRFAYISMKTLIAKVVSEYFILPGTKTRNPLQLDTRTFFITVHPIDGLHVKLKKRSNL